MGLNKTKKIHDWCDGQFFKIGGARKIIRCPECNKRLLPQQVNLDPLDMLKDGKSIAWQLPPHKAK